MKVFLVFLICFSIFIVVTFKQSKFSTYQLLSSSILEPSSKSPPPYEPSSNSPPPYDTNDNDTLPYTLKPSQKKDEEQKPQNRIRKMYVKAKVDGALALKEMEEHLRLDNSSSYITSIQRDCVENVTLLRDNILKQGQNVKLPCGLANGSSIIIVGKILVGFILELKGSNVRDSPILHVNPRIEGGRCIIEIKSGLFRKRWGTPQCCKGRRMKKTIDGKVQCEAWIRGNNTFYPILKDHTFHLKIVVGLEGYHISIDGLHVASFPFREGFTSADVAYLSVAGDIKLEAIKLASLPSVDPLNTIEKLEKLKVPAVSISGIDLFIGVCSKSDNFAERMTIRSTWMQSPQVRSSQVLARFFVGLHKDTRINLQIKKEADYFQDMVVLPILDHYDLQAYKTFSICEHGINMHASYIMKADDDTFVRVDAILDILKEVKNTSNIYLGCLHENVTAKDLNTTKWAISSDEWPNDAYIFPRYALGGSGYIISHDIAKFVASHVEDDTLEIIRLEDIVMGMWVHQYSKSQVVQYMQHRGFGNWGCSNGYATIHLWSNHQMHCQWNELKNGKVHCCL